jgi:small nuclear ribonucleoprotein D3
VENFWKVLGNPPLIQIFSRRLTFTQIAEDNMNVQLRDITVTARDGRVSHLDQVYIRGSHVRFFIVPDMLRNAPMFRQKDRKGRGVGLARGRATVSRARGQRGPSGRG